jgi:hypothetical protein
MSWAVIPLVSDDYNIINVGKISHTAAVPEPATLTLLGFGLISVGAAVRMRRIK